MKAPMKLAFSAALLVVAQGGGATAGESKVYFLAPQDGAAVTSPFKVVFGLSGMGVAPAGVMAENTGHHHLLINTKLADPKVPIPKDDRHLHYGGGQTEAMVELPPGKHTLQLVVGDFKHVPHNPPLMSERITVEVR